MIAVKREVAVGRPGRFFRGANVKLGNWRQVTVRIRSIRFRIIKEQVFDKERAGVWDTGIEQSGIDCIYGKKADVWVSHDTHGRVYSHRLSY